MLGKEVVHGIYVVHTRWSGLWSADQPEVPAAAASAKVIFSMAAAPPQQAAAYRLVVADELGTLKGDSSGSATPPQ